MMRLNSAWITGMSLAVLVLTGFSLPEQALWKVMGRWNLNERIAEIAVERRAGIFYAATENGHIYLLEASGTWKDIGSIAGSSIRINDLYIEEDTTGDLYAAADNGLYLLNRRGQLKKIFTTKDYLSEHCLSVRVDDRVYLGTTSGFYYRARTDNRWEKIGYGLNNMPVLNVMTTPDAVLAATPDAVYRIAKEDLSVEKVYSTIGTLPEEKGPENEDDVEALPPVGLAVSSDNRLAAAALGGRVIISDTAGKRWESLPAYELSFPVRDLCIDREGALWAATKDGVFRKDRFGWKQVFRGLTTNRVNDLETDKEGNLYAATDRGIYVLAYGAPDMEEKANAVNWKDLQFSDEPTIGEVHSMAIDYAEVSPRKIREWRSLAKTRAILPDLSVGLDRSGTDLFHWDTGQSPDVLVTGREYIDWDVSLSWDLGDLVWSTDQTTIDSRSKLMVELREDILDEVTRLYFERRRLQMEERQDPEKGDPVLARDRFLRIEELTALIDALTGGKFSAAIGHVEGP